MINTQNFGPYLSGHFVEHRSSFIYILHQASFCSNTTPLHIVCPKVTNVVNNKWEQHKILDFQVIDTRNFGHYS